MKTKFGFIIALLFAMLACEKEQMAPSSVKDPVSNKSGLFLKLHGIGKDIKPLLIASDISKSNGSLSYGRVAKGDSVIISGDTTTVVSKDSTVTVEDQNWEWESCATITSYTDDKGYSITVMDYGDNGCMECGFLIKGKLTIKWKDSAAISSWTEIYENYSYGDVTLNGTASYVSEGTFYVDSVKMKDYEFTYTVQEDFTVSEGGKSYKYTSSFKEKATERYWIVLEGNFDMSVSTGEKYSYSVAEPVVIDMQCNNSFIPVKGIEKWDGTDGKFEINYGDGTCDDLAVITENGKTEEVDLGELCFNEEKEKAVSKDSTNVDG